jgi:Zinc knuckle
LRGRGDLGEEPAQEPETEREPWRRPASTLATDRHRKIFEAERQLAKAAMSFVGQTDQTDIGQTTSQTAETVPSIMVGDKRMVAPSARDAPSFRSTRPEELRRFIRSMEDLWREAGVTKDESKKSMIGKYADQDSEEEWIAFRTYGEGHSWEEFKAEIIRNYPEAAAAERGTPARIKEVCIKHRNIRLGDMNSLSALRRAFMSEARKLQQDPPAMGNRELVELFIGCLSPTFASAVLQFLGNKVSSDSPKKDTTSSGKAREDATQKSRSRRPEDKYDLEDVSKAATEVSENSQGMFDLLKREPSVNAEERGVFLFSQPASESNTLTQKVEEIEGVQALERDRLVTINKTMESKMSGLEDMIKTLLSQGQHGDSKGTCKGDCKGSGCKAHDTSGNSMQKWGSGKSMENERCFYCGRMGHFQADCDELKEQVRTGNLKVNPEGRLRLRDGSLIPGFPHGASIKERIEKHYAKRPTQFYYGASDDEVLTGPTVSAYPASVYPAPAYPAQLSQVGEDAERRRARLERELDLREKEEALELRKLKLEREEKKLEQSSGSSRSMNVLDLLGQLSDEDFAAIKASRGGFN